MLVLSRKSGQRVVIGGEIVVSVIEIRGDKVRLGIQAARSIPVHREEVHEELQSRARHEQDSQMEVDANTEAARTSLAIDAAANNSGREQRS
ncbi:carbon storage regulator [Aporhodopirellula aestuarii]|uniref:Translational regulator CsrA n=1 Tax=Aporhodopirellula aestuarii TaxID=2950107 RepID=A0ABT0U210_9BACT|nr:carbon storage regulator [Aporhodopirellula aestuarii]MCM2370936.1 carbon storage regulator [Aporhodopirellula aestuarii]